MHTQYTHAIHICNTQYAYTIFSPCHSLPSSPLSLPSPILLPPSSPITLHPMPPLSPLLPSPPNSSSTEGNKSINICINYFFHWPPPLCAVTIEAYIEDTFSSADRERTRTGKFGSYKFIEREELLSNDALTSVPGVQMKAVGSKELTSIVPGASIVFEEKKYWIAGQCMS